MQKPTPEMCTHKYQSPIKTPNHRPITRKSTQSNNNHTLLSHYKDRSHFKSPSERPITHNTAFYKTNHMKDCPRQHAISKTNRIKLSLPHGDTGDNLGVPTRDLSCKGKCNV